MDKNINKDMLLKRIKTHDKYSKNNIDDWISNIIKVRENESLLDVGCGTGKQLIPISKKTKGVVVGVDISKESLDYIKDNIGEKENVRLIQSSIEDMYGKVKDFGPFDVIISCFAVYYSKEKQKTLIKLKNLLKNKGRLFLCGPGLENNKALLELHSRVKELPKMHKGYFENFAINFLKNNFSKVETFTFRNPVEFPNVDSLVEYWLSYSIGDPDKAEEFRKEAEKEFKEGKFVTVKEVIGVLAFK